VVPSIVANQRADKIVPQKKEGNRLMRSVYTFFPDDKNTCNRSANLAPIPSSSWI
jgi:hypothetical protein